MVPILEELPGGGERTKQILTEMPQAGTVSVLALLVNSPSSILPVTYVQLSLIKTNSLSAFVCTMETVRVAQSAADETENLT